MLQKYTVFDAKPLILLIIGLCIMLSTMVIPINAQDDTWEVYVYRDGEILSINQDGEVLSATPILSENEITHTDGISFDRAGSRAFFCVLENSETSDLYQTTIRVVEVGNPTPIYNFDLGETLDCRVSGIQHDAGFFTVGVINYDPLGTAIDDERPLWQLLLLDPFFAEVVGEINANTPDLPADILPDIAYLPVARRIHFDIVFSMIPYYGGDSVIFPTYLWRRNGATDLVEAISGWGRLNYDYLIRGDLGHLMDISVGEFISPRYSDALGIRTDTTVAPANMVEVYTNDTVSTIYTNEEAVIFDSTFINNGEAVALLLAYTSGIQIELLERDGTTTTLETPAMINAKVIAVPNGFVILWQGEDQDQHLTHYPMDGESREIWSSTEQATVIWATPSTIAENLPAFVEALP